jgi:hypothetical protein
MPRGKKAVFTKAEIAAMRRSRSPYEVEDIEIDEEPEAYFDEDDLDDSKEAAPAPQAREKRRVQTRGRKPKTALPEKRNKGGRPKKIVAEAVLEPKAKKTEETRLTALPRARKQSAGNGVDYHRILRARRIASHYELPVDAAENIARTFTEEQLIDAERQLFPQMTEPQAYDRRHIDRDVGEVSWTRDGKGGVELGGVKPLTAEQVTKENIAAKFAHSDAMHKVLADKFKVLEELVQELYSHFKAQNQGRVYGA